MKEMELPLEFASESHDRLVVHVERLMSERALLYRTLERLLNAHDLSQSGGDVTATLIELKAAQNDLRITRTADLAPTPKLLREPSEELLREQAVRTLPLSENGQSVSSEMVALRTAMEAERSQWELKENAWSAERGRLKSQLEETRKQRDKVAAERHQDKKEMDAKQEQLLQDKVRLSRCYDEIKRERDRLLAQKSTTSSKSGGEMDQYDRDQILREKFIMSSRMGQMQQEIDFRSREQKNLRTSIRKVHVESEQARKRCTSLEVELKQAQEALNKAREAVMTPKAASCGKCARLGSLSPTSPPSPTHLDGGDILVGVLPRSPRSPTRKPINANLVEDMKAAEKKTSPRSNPAAAAVRLGATGLQTVLEAPALENENTDAEPPLLTI